jgi:hypothetical protein
MHPPAVTHGDLENQQPQTSNVFTPFWSPRTIPTMASRVVDLSIRFMVLTPPVADREKCSYDAYTRASHTPSLVLSRS